MENTPKTPQITRISPESSEKHTKCPRPIPKSGGNLLRSPPRLGWHQRWAECYASVFPKCGFFATTTEAGVPIQGPTATLIYDDWYPAFHRQASVAGLRSRDSPCCSGPPAGAGPHRRRPLLRHSRFMPAPRHSALRRLVQRATALPANTTAGVSSPCHGQCREIPSLTSHDKLDPCRIYATAFPCEERDGHLWVYVPPSGRGRIREERPRRPAASSRGAKVQPALSFGASHR